MKHLPNNVRGTRDDARGYGYIVTMPDGTEEWHRLAWQATARAHGWVPPVTQCPQCHVVALYERSGGHQCSHS